MGEEEALDLLKRVIRHNINLVAHHQNPVKGMLNWCYCYGGDSTFLLISHYGDKLESMIATELPIILKGQSK